MQQQLAEKLKKDLAQEIDVFSQMELDTKISEEKISLLLGERAKSEAEKTAQQAIQTLRNLGLSNEKVIEMLSDDQGTEIGSTLKTFLASQPQASQASEASEPSVASQPSVSEAWLKPETTETSEGSESKKAKTV